MKLRIPAKFISKDSSRSWVASLFILGLLFSSSVLASDDTPTPFCIDYTTFPVGGEVGPLSELQCEGYGDNIRGMCQCMSRVFGNTITSSEEYKQFDSDVLDFDVASTSMMEFTQDLESMEMATMANFIASTMPGSSPPFSPGGVCFQRFQAYETRVNAEGPVSNSYTPISDFFYRQTDFNYLTSEGFNSESLNTALDNFWQVRSGERGSALLLNRRTNRGNRFIDYLHNTIHSGAEGESLFNRSQRSINQSHARPNDASSLGVSKEDAIASLCDGLVDRFDEMRQENETYLTPGQLIDRENRLADRELNLLDIPAFRGLEVSYFESNPDNQTRDALFFRQRLCSFMNEDFMTDEVSRPENEEIRGLNDDELRNNIIMANDVMERFSGEIEAAELRLEVMSDQYQETKSILEEQLPNFGLTYDQYSTALDAAGADANPVAILEDLLAEAGSGERDLVALETLFRNAQHYHVLDRETDVLAESLAYMHRSSFEYQTRINDSFQELAHRRGGLTAAANFVGRDEVLSRTARYYERVLEDRNADYIGPRLGHHHLMGGFAGIANGLASDIVSRAREVATIQAHTETAVSDLSELFDGEGHSTTAREALSSMAASDFSAQRVGGSQSGERVVRDDIIRSSIQGRPSIFAPETSIVGLGGSAQQVSRPESSVVGDIITSGLAPVAGNGPVRRETAATTNQNFVGSQFLAQQQQRRSAQNRTPATESPQAAVNTTIADLEARIEELQRRNQSSPDSADPRGEATRNGGGENDLLREELTRLQSEVERLRSRSRTLAQRQAEVTSVPATPVTETPPPAAAESLRAFPSIARGPSRSRAATSSAPVEGTPVGGGGGSSAPASSLGSSAPVTSRGTGIEVPYSGSSSVDSDGPAIGNFEGLNLTLINGSVGFAEVNANDLSVAPVEVGLDFLNLSENGKLDFIESFFSDTTAESAVIRQADGRVVVIEKNRGFRPAESEADIADLNADELLRNQADTVHRVRTMNSALDKFFE